MSTLITGFIGPQEIIIVILLLLILPVTLLAAFFIIRAIRKSKSNNIDVVNEVKHRSNK